MDKLILFLVFLVFFLVGSAIGAFIVGFFVMLLWNYVVPTITHGALTEISYLQAVALSLLTSILFKSSVSTNNK